ncbi:hypothetical protein JOD45_001319 [Scopulibacillus daqui]|uniref:Fur-regulated basic protein A n=1 Tax=Scopulibacillus daqui TaxID=1469162 RepID=A0ABS2PYH6_9BACL|nr:Fur-regulated basic protein FbpA [Scopulibacillus daqui]MBM7645108.1 hypothetical protein [Scopulibacillus daqui]
MKEKSANSNQKDTYIQRLLNEGIFKINGKQLYEYTIEQLESFYKQRKMKGSHR